MKLNEEIDTGQVLSAQDIADRRRERESVDNLPEVQALRRKVRQMRINMDNYPEGSKEEAELISQIKATNQQIQKYYQQVNQLRSQYGFNQPKRGTIKMNEEQLRSLIAESVNNVLNEIGNTPQGMYALGQVAGRAYDRMFNGTKNSVGDGVVALNPKYGKVAQDAAYAAAGGYMDWKNKFKEQNGREPSDDEYRAWMQNYI